MPYNPPTVTFLLEGAGLRNGDPSYDDLQVTASTWSAFPSPSLPVWIDGWCVAEETGIVDTLTYTAKVYSSYEYDLLRANNPDFANVGNNPLLPLVPGVPYDSLHPAQPYLANLSIVNWLLGNITIDAFTYSDTVTDSVTLELNHTFSGIHYYKVAGLGGHYTYGDIEQSIYQLLGDGQAIGDTFLGSYNMVDVAAIVADAVGHPGYIPDAGDKIAVLLDTSTPGHIRQPLLIETLAAKLGNYVWNDLNANGIQDEGGITGIFGAKVNLV